MSTHSGQHSPQLKSVVTELSDLQEPAQELVPDQAEHIHGGVNSAPREANLTITLTNTMVSGYS